MTASENKSQAVANLNPRDIGLELSSSRATLELGEPWEILLHVSNHSELPVWVTAVATTLILPAEVLHPSEQNVASRGAQLSTVSGYGFDCLCIRPGGQCTCTWRINEDREEQKENSKPVDVLLWHIFFHPGKYSIEAGLHVWAEEPDMAALAGPKIAEHQIKTEKALIKKARDRLSLLRKIRERRDVEGLLAPKGRTQERPGQNSQAEDDSDPTQSSEPATEAIRSVAAEEMELAEKLMKIDERQLPLKKSQLQALEGSLVLAVSGEIEVTTKSLTTFGASAFGGLLAFTFRELYWATTDPSNLGLKDLAILPIYILTAIIISLLVSRITEAKFPLTVKIMDFWGATAFGVIAAFVGDALLQRLLQFIG